MAPRSREIIGEAGRPELTVIVVDYLLVEGRPDALRDGAVMVLGVGAVDIRLRALWRQLFVNWTPWVRSLIQLPLA
jgi:hypothetical protein